MLWPGSQTCVGLNVWQQIFNCSLHVFGSITATYWLYCTVHISKTFPPPAKDKGKRERVHTEGSTATHVPGFTVSFISPFSVLLLKNGVVWTVFEQKSKRCGEVRLLCGLLVESTDRASVVYGAEIRSAAESASLSHFYLCLLQLRGLWQQTAFVSSVGPRSPRTWELNINVMVGFYTEVLWESVSQDPLQSGLFGRSRLVFFFL